MSGLNVKDMVKKGAIKSGGLRLAARLSGPTAVILMYHSVQFEPQKFANTIGTGIIHASPEFEKQMEFIARKYRPISLCEILRFLNGECQLAGRTVAVTFDDGFADNLEIAAPILRKFGIPAAFYVTESLIGTTRMPWYSRLRMAFAMTEVSIWQDPLSKQIYVLTSRANRETALLAAFERCAPLAGEEQEAMMSRIENGLQFDTDREVSHNDPLMMNWNQVRSLVREGHIVGSHTSTHPNLAYVKTDNVLWEEISESKHKIERQLGSPVNHFSYPHPALGTNWNERTVAVTRQVGFQTAVTTTRGRIWRQSDPLHLARIGAPLSLLQFSWELERTFLGPRA